MLISFTGVSDLCVRAAALGNQLCLFFSRPTDQNISLDARPQEDIRMWPKLTGRKLEIQHIVG